MDRCVRDCLADIFDDPGFVIFLLDARGQFNGVHGFAHALCVITGERLFIHHLQRVDFAQMEMWVDESLCHQISLGIDQLLCLHGEVFFERGNVSICDANIKE